MADDQQVAEAEEEAGLEDADDLLEAGVERAGSSIAREPAVDDPVAAVGDDTGEPSGSRRIAVVGPERRGAGARCGGGRTG